MRCFNHSEREAVGICKACQRGLCVECLTDLEDGLACKGHHEDQVNALNALISRNLKINSITPRARYAAPLFYVFMGAVFVIYGYFNGREVQNLLVTLGIGFLAFGIYIYFYNRKAYSPNSPNSPKA
jgi:hypothetical protein